MKKVNNYSYGAVQMTHQFIKDYVKKGDLCIDATAGRGKDTLFLCQLTGDSGKVLAFDIQEEAIESTKKLLKEHGICHIGEMILDSHINIDKYAENGSVSCIVFNFGWLPGSDHQISTIAETSIAAIEKGLSLLAPGGIMSLCIYHGKDTGFEERDTLLSFLKNINNKQYTVIVSEFFNHQNYPPIPVFILKA